MSEPKKEMSFLQHLEALRWHLVRSVVVIMMLAVVAFLYPQILFDKVILGPSEESFVTYRAICKFSHWAGKGDELCVGEFAFSLKNINMSGQFFSHMWISFLAGLVLGFPYLLWEIWRFVKPALKDREIQYVRGFVFYASFLFFTGVLFSYFIIAPLTILFLGNYQVSPLIGNEITMDSYISTITNLTFATGIVFELPIVVYFLTSIGLLGPAFMRRYRRHALVVILIISAFITPSPDISSQVMVAIPLYCLYEISIFVSRYVENKQRKAG
ncbi:MAG: twin-arginine translocase subunit TatC [Bacteroidia bacterium]|nr:twin-arginine translocase subunit TatC [Bacteroidia bacterium]